MELVNEAPINSVAAKYKFSRGVLQQMQQMTSTFAGIVTAFCRALNWEMLALIISQFQQRLFFGVHQDLVDLMQLSVLNGQRARALHAAGFQTLIDIANANVLDIEKCLHDCVGFDSKKRDGESNYEAEQRNRERSLFVTGKSGLSVKEAAKMIINEARSYLESEMRIQHVNWANTSGSAQVQVLEENNIEKANDDLDKPDVANDEDAEVNPTANDISASVMQRGKTIKPKTPAKDIPPATTESEDEFAIDDVISFEDESIPTQSDLLDTSHILNGRKTEPSAAQFNHINIIDVFKNRLYFLKFEEDFEKFTECSLSLAIQKQDPSRKDSSNNCAIADGAYIGGVALCIESNVAFYLDLQDGDENQVALDQRIAFLKNLISRPNFTLKISNAKDQLKLLMKGIPDIESIACAMEDPKVAHWLLQPETENSIARMVRLNNFG